MPFNDLEHKHHEKLVGQFIEQRRPAPHIRKELDLDFRIDGQSIQIFEIRPVWNNPSKKLESPAAKATWIKTQKCWKVFWMRADLKWHGYEPCLHVKTLEEFLKLVDNDPYGCFWG